MQTDCSLALAFAGIAFIYASVGFGGGSSYVALLATFGLPISEIKLTALLCNIVVVTGGVLVFQQKKQILFGKIAPFVIFSVPMAFLGARMKISETTFFLLLGASLLLAALFLWLQPTTSETDFSTKNKVRDGFLGGSVGLLSGMVGLGGGIFLSPILHFLKWDSARKIAATASVFILANSLAGIAGQLSNFNFSFNWSRIALLAAAVFIGGQIGSRVSQTWFSLNLIQKVTAFLVFSAGLEVVWKNLN
jgi:uncharacterized protein